MLPARLSFIVRLLHMYQNVPNLRSKESEWHSRAAANGHNPDALVSMRRRFADTPGPEVAQKPAVLALCRIPYVLDGAIEHRESLEGQQEQTGADR